VRTGAVLRNVLRVRLGQLLDRRHDGRHTAIHAHGLGREVGVRARAWRRRSNSL
jgi:hypothetical protein